MIDGTKVRVKDITFEVDGTQFSLPVDVDVNLESLLAFIEELKNDLWHLEDNKPTVSINLT